jgi:dipeptidyl aminopeptidase/acylaminoacyl peptidase
VIRRRSLSLGAALVAASCHFEPPRSELAAAHPDAAPAPPPPRAPYGPAALAAAVDITELAIAPDGDEVAWVSDKSGSLELYSAPLSGAGLGAAVQRTHAKEVVSGVRYAPDGAAILFEMDHGGDERTDLWIARRGAAEPEPLTRTPLAEGSVRFRRDGRAITFVADPARPFRFNIHTMDLRTRKVRQLTRLSDNVLAPLYSRDGRRIVATHTPDDQRGELLVIDAASGKSERIAPPRKDGVLWPVAFLPSGLLLARATNAGGFMQLATVDIVKKTVVLVGPETWDVEAAEVADDGTIAISRNVHGESEVSLLSASALSAAPRVLLHGGVVLALALDRAGKTLVLAQESAEHPAEMIAIRLAGEAQPAPAVLVPPDLGGVNPAELARAERRQLTSFDGTPIDAYLLRPPVFRLGMPPPAVVQVHGGPNGQVRGSFSPTAQAMAEAGFLVIAPNYRGSTGYGRAFEDLNNKDWGGGDLKDLLAVVGSLARSQELDGARVGITGGSYGGYMTLRAITAAPESWRAAVEMYGMPDLEEDYRLTEDRFGTWYRTEMGDPVKDKALYVERSPIHALDRVRAKLLVIQGANDTNVPKAESDNVVEALKKRGQPVEYVVYPNEGHGLTHRENQLDAIERTVRFFSANLGLPEPGH